MLIGGIAALVVGAVLVVTLRLGATSPLADRPLPSSTLLTGAGRVSQGFRSAETPGASSVIEVSAPEITEAELEGLTTWWSMGALVTVPARFEVHGGMPAGGVRLTRTYAAPLPAGVEASFVYFDPTLRGWKLTESVLSADRRTLTAEVHHLSDWADIVFGGPGPMEVARDSLAAAGATVVNAAARGLDQAAAFQQSVQQAFVEGLEWGYYGVGAIFDVRVDRPQCKGKVPDWVLGAVEPAHDKNNPILFCVGRDPRRDDLIVIKARINRGFGFFARTAVEPDWIHNSTYDQGLVDSSLKIVAGLDRAFATKITEVTGGGRLVGPGEEIALGFTEDQVREAEGHPLLILSLPGPEGFLASVIAKQLVSSGLDASHSVITGVLTLATCVDDIAKIRDNLLAIPAAAVSCLEANDDAVARKISLALVKNKHRTAKEAGEIAGKAIARAAIYLALVGPAFNILNWAAEHAVDEAIRSVSVFAKPFRCNASDIARDLGQRATREVVLCHKVWAITEEKDALGDTEQLVRRVGKTWRFVTGFPSEYCRDDLKEMKAPDAVLKWFRTCPSGTRVLTAFPLSLYGRLTAGWRIEDQRQSGLVLDCESYASQVASTGGVWKCVGNGNNACWADPQNPGRQVLCGTFSANTMVLRRYYGTLGASPQPLPESETIPWSILLSDGTRCNARDGGSWSGRPNDDLRGAYSCETKDFLVVLTDYDVDPIDRSAETWTVRVGYLENDPRADDPPKRVKVVKAWYAGGWE